MNDTESLIVAMGRNGKTPLVIAQELLARGITALRGQVFSPAMIEAFLRFSDMCPGGMKVRKKAVSVRRADSDDGVPEKKRKNRWHAGQSLSDELKVKITQLFHHDNLKSNEIAERLGVSLRKIAPFCAVLSGFTMPPGEVTTFTDAGGRTITRLPPGYARGAYPQRNVRPTQGGY